MPKFERHSLGKDTSQQERTWGSQGLDWAVVLRDKEGVAHTVHFQKQQRLQKILGVSRQLKTGSAL